MKPLPKLTSSLLATLLASACAPISTTKTAAPGYARDPHSHAQPERVRVTHVSLDLAIDMVGKVVIGRAKLALARTDRGAPLVLDVQGLAIESINGTNGQE